MTAVKQIICRLIAVSILMFSATSFASDNTLSDNTGSKNISSGNARAFLDGITDYRENDFAGAITKFSEIAGTGIKNGKLFYNLGNTYLKNGEIGYAVLWYERAMQLIPNDPDLKFNLEYARSLVKDATEDKISPVFKILFFWKYLFSESTVQWAGIVLNAIFCLFLAMQWRKKNRIVKTTGYVVLFISMLFILTAFYNYYEKTYLKYAVILPLQTSVKSGFADKSTELFVLHAGTKVKVDRQTEKFIKIVFSKGKIGWIKKSEAGLI